jgi:Holliday junction resolvase RusA-like endonuclease
MIRIKLPIPPSLNQAYSNLPGKGRIASHALKNWKLAAGWALQALRPGSVTGPYRFTIYLPAQMPGDVSNRIKCAEDLLVAHCITPDDSKAWSAHAERSHDVKAGECLIVVEAM